LNPVQADSNPGENKTAGDLGMLTYEDCVGLAELTEDEIEAIAQHEHIPEIVAAELGNYLVHDPEGVPKIKHIILDDIEEARRHDDLQRMVHLKLVLKHFIDTHPLNPAR
jgi:hypothetical protein